MGKFNEKVSEEKNLADHIREELYGHPDATRNYEGALSFKVDPLTELYLKAASSLIGEPKYYTDANQSDRDLIEAIHNVAKIDPEFILKLALYCREKLYLRSVPLVLIAEFANNPNCIGIENSRKYVKKCVKRADELTELIAYQLKRNNLKRNNFHKRKTKLPMLIRFGVSLAFPKFDEYQIAKYNKSGKVKMKDAMFMTHPKPLDKVKEDLFHDLANDELESPETWEVMRSAGDTWHDIIYDIFYKDGKINNYMAMLKNIRNCLKDESVTKEDIILLCQMISDKNAVLHSKQLPFRYLAAYRELYGNIDREKNRFSPEGNLYLMNVLDSIEIAASHSIDNFPKLTGGTLIACDVSGSMQKVISKRSSIQRFDIGIMLGMIANKFCEFTITGMFGDHWKIVPMSKNSGILRNVLEMHRREGEVGYSTNGYKVIEYLINNDIKVDRIMIFTDCQMWDSDNNELDYGIYGRKIFETTFAETYLKYQKRYPDVKLYAFDLSGYGDIMVPENTKNVCLVGGFSDRIFDFIEIFEKFGEGVIKKIKEIKP